MFNDNSKAADTVNSALTAAASAVDNLGAKGRYMVQCRDQQGNLKWETEVEDNLVVNVGLQDMNTKYFTGSSYSATWYLGLITGPGVTTSATDTMSSHGFTEFTGYSQSTRPTCTFGSATSANPSVISNSGSPAAFSITSTGTIGGAFLTSNNTKGGTTGILFSEKAFSSPGDRSVVNGDTLTVSYSFSLTAT
jgi:hypothetical protein